MENSARITGYAIALFFLGGMLALILFIRDGGVFRSHEVKVLFPIVGTLMEDDPVKLRGVEVGRVSRIAASDQGPVVTLELYRRTPLAKDTRFVNFNYSLFGARMIILVPGTSQEPLDAKDLPLGEFSNGVSETIHRVDELLRAMLEYKALSAQLENGDGNRRSLTALLNQSIYPALDDFSRFAKKLETLQDRAEGDMQQAAAFSDAMNRSAAIVAARTDTLMGTAARALDRVAVLTAQSEALLATLDKLMAAAQDTTRPAGRLVMDRDLYDRTLALTRDLRALIEAAKTRGLHDIIHFWRNVDVRAHRKQ
jgi:phospholipid/cholesterol/gamma-HCH transport system substrate-binding protein